MQIGCHVSIAGGIGQIFKTARELGCETFQIFTQNQRQWRQKSYSAEEIEQFVTCRQAYGYAHAILTAHASYLINLCATDPENLVKSRSALVAELERCQQLGISYLIMHPGSHGGQGEKRGIKMIAESVDRAMEQSDGTVMLLLETVAGQGTAIGRHFGQLGDIMAASSYADRLGICIDTCHIHGAGYTIGTEEEWEQVIRQIEENTGLDRVCAFHLNDSTHEAGSRRDRHERLGRGAIGEVSFRFLMREKRFKKIPGILEVPGGLKAFDEDLEFLRRLRSADRPV